MEIDLNSLFPRNIYNDYNRFMVSWWVTDSYFNNEKFKLVILKLLLLHIVHQDHLDQEEGPNILYITNIQA